MRKEQSEWPDFDLTDLLRLMKSAMIEANVPSGKIRQTFAVLKRQARYGQPLELEVDRISQN